MRKLKSSCGGPIDPSSTSLAASCAWRQCDMVYDKFPCLCRTRRCIFASILFSCFFHRGPMFLLLLPYTMHVYRYEYDILYRFLVLPVAPNATGTVATSSWRVPAVLRSSRCRRPAAAVAITCTSAEKNSNSSPHVHILDAISRARAHAVTAQSVQRQV